jgi:hypothetical protein
MSTIVAFDPKSGAVVAKYSVTGRCDGLTADPIHHRLLASVNEDNNSSLYVITPGNPTAKHYTYSPEPAETGGPATPQLDDIERVTGRGTLYAVDQKTGSIYAIDTAGVEPGTFFVSQPNPSSGDLPNDPALGVVDLHSGVVTHVDSTLASPKGLLFVPAHHEGDDG